ncbi:MAG: hypothetical protein U0Y10_04965 [Spirosomataceae bacterium]
MNSQQTFITTASRYGSDSRLIERLWGDITQRYAESHRHYHTLAHLNNLIHELEPLKATVQDWDVLVFSVVYHDVIYRATQSDNEAKSAELAQNQLQKLGVDTSRIQRCKMQILATQHHQESTDPDANLLTDADLAILGKEWPTYQNYCQQIRQEYAIFPDFLYRPGRRKVLHHFLEMDKIFKTPHFYTHYEQQARQNLAQELAELS